MSGRRRNGLSDGAAWVTHPWVAEGERRVRFGVDGGMRQGLGPRWAMPSPGSWAIEVLQDGRKSLHSSRRRGVDQDLQVIDPLAREGAECLGQLGG